jgi:hypothetical protein
VPIVTGSKFEILFQPRAPPNVRAERGNPANPREDLNLRAFGRA